MTKILQVVGQMTTGGMETLIMNLYRNIDRKKVQFDILTYYETPGEYDEEVRELGGNVFIAARSNNPFIFMHRIKNFFKEHHDYQAIHVHTTWLGWVYFKYAQKYGISRKIIHLHTFGSELKGLKIVVRWLLANYSLQKADTILACSNKAAQYYHADLRKTYFFPNGINADKFLYNESERKRMRNELDIEGKFVLLCVARFAIPKNHDFLIDILKSLTKYSKDIVLLLVGKGPLEQKIKDKVNNLELNDYVRFLGVRKDVNVIMQAADSYVMPSLWEGLGIAYIESQTAGLVSFISKQAVTQEVKITELLHTIPIEAGADEWAREIWENRQYIRENRSVELQKSGFDIKQTAHNLEKFYVEGVNLFKRIEKTDN